MKVSAEYSICNSGLQSESHWISSITEKGKFMYATLQNMDGQNSRTKFLGFWN